MGKQQILFITILYILSLYNVLARKQYEDLIYFFSTQRKEIDTQKPTISVVYGPYKEVGSFSNKKILIILVSLAIRIPQKIQENLALEQILVPIIWVQKLRTLGGELSWSKTVSLSDKKLIPANKVGRAYVRDKISTAIFRNKIQIQEKVSGKWKNKGPVRTSISKVITTTQELKINIEDN